MDQTSLHSILTNYDILAQSIDFIRHNENCTYKVVGSIGKQYLLRIHQPVTENFRGVQHTREGLASEMKLLKRLAEQTELIVQAPVPNRLGDYVTEWVSDEETICCTLLRWIDGISLSDQDMEQSENAYRLGSYTAKLHAHFQSSDHTQYGFRPVYGLERNEKMIGQILTGQQLGLFGNNERIIVEEVFKHINLNLKSLGIHAGSWGMVHADINRSNIIVSEGGWSFIDFCLSGYGYYLMDVGAGALMMKGEKKELFLKGYSDGFPLEDDPLRLLEGFMLLAIFGYYAFHMQNKEKHVWIRERLPRLCETYCKPFLEDKPIFYQL
ncbi:phosphotransferase enzyme family protein [Paenibacillus sp. UNC451MF]|uniref:phosphotransferase enzyme family protein n=1 Tax=Paenibacillus sp. UNC451MF TaxID=1449063 RepID=UPI000565A3C2|nr:phosphotransferase [Paenibacillus sp. UNC451MF]